MQAITITLGLLLTAIFACLAGVLIGGGVLLVVMPLVTGVASAWGVISGMFGICLLLAGYATAVEVAASEW